jgi:hypothetical protein
MANSVEGCVDLGMLLAEAIEALAVLDVAAIEALGQFLEDDRGRIALPHSPAAWARARSLHWILGHLLGGTANRLAMLRRVSVLPSGFGAYGDNAVLDLSRRQVLQIVPPQR